MSQYDAQSPILSDAQSGTTNAREITAFVLAEIIKYVAAYGLTYLGLLSPLYQWALHTGKLPLLLIVSAGISAVWGIVVFVLFVVFRAGFGGIPAIIAPREQGSPVITCGTEVGAFALAYAIVLGVILLMNGFFLAQVYVALGRSLAPLVGLGISIVGTFATFALFVGFRQTMTRR
jgi:hypothetical protein